MTNVKIKVTGADVSVTVTGGLTVGMTGATYEVAYDQSWDQLAKLVVFRAGVNQLAAVDGLIPAALLREERTLVEVGVEGRDQEGKLIVPTIWADMGFVLPSASSDGATNIDPDNPVWAQSAAIAQDALEKVKSLEQRADDGEFQGAPGPQGPGYKHSEEFSRLANQVHADTEIASNAAKLSGQNASHAGKAAQEAQAQAVRAKQEADQISSQLANVASCAAELPADVPVELSGETVATTQGVLNALATMLAGNIKPNKPATHAVTYQLKNVTCNNAISFVTHGAEYMAELIPESGFYLETPIIMMGAVNITDSAWKSPNIIISEVVDDVTITCTANQKSTGEDTSPIIAEFDKTLDQKGGINNGPLGACYTEFYKLNPVDRQLWMSFPSKTGVVVGAYGKTQTWNEKNGFLEFWTGIYQNGEEALANIEYHGVVATKFRASLITAEIDDSYAYGKESGTVYFAGKNTKYFGKRNINTSEEKQPNKCIATDEAYTMEGMSAYSNSDVIYPDITNEWAAMVKSNYKSFCSEAFESCNRIPFVLYTDMHDQFRNNEGTFHLIGDLANWYEISACINLGDTCGNNFSNSQLDKYRKAIEGHIPYCKRIEAYGNHDVWGKGQDGYTFDEPQGRLVKYLRAIFANHRADNGYYTVIDHCRDVKYLVISDYEYINNTRLCRMSSDQAEFIINELSAQDGNDIIICSHQPLDTNKHMISRDPDYMAFDEKFLYGPSNESFLAMIKARHDFTAGVFVDGDGVEHPYDFTGLKSKLLCSFHGHDHFEAYYQLPDSITEIVFDYFKPDRTFYWGYVDRKAMKLKLWKNQIGVGTLEINLT